MSITTKKEYLDQLHKYLKKLPREDYEDAMEYFTEYFEETDEEGAQKLMEELGTPKQAARDLIGNLLDKKTNAYHTSAPSPNAYNTTSELPKKRKKSHIIWIACLALLAAPIGGPLLVAAVVVIFCIFLCLALLLFCGFLLVFCGIIAGVVIAIRGILAIPFSSAGFAVVAGSGLLILGVSILSALFIYWLCRLAARLFVKLARHLTNRTSHRQNLSNTIGTTGKESR